MSFDEYTTLKPIQLEQLMDADRIAQEDLVDFGAVLIRNLTEPFSEPQREAFRIPEGKDTSSSSPLVYMEVFGRDVVVRTAEDLENPIRFSLEVADNQGVYLLHAIILGLRHLGFTFLHGVLTYQGSDPSAIEEPLLFLGSATAGKSTFAGALASGGEWSILADDILFFRPDAEGLEVISLERTFKARGIESKQEVIREVPAINPGTAPYRLPKGFSRLIYPTYLEDQSAAVSELGSREAFERLMRGHVIYEGKLLSENRYAFNQRDFSRYGEIVETTPSLEVTYCDEVLPDAVALLQGALSG